MNEEVWKEKQLSVHIMMTFMQDYRNNTSDESDAACVAQQYRAADVSLGTTHMFGLYFWKNLNVEKMLGRPRRSVALS